MYLFDDVDDLSDLFGSDLHGNVVHDLVIKHLIESFTGDVKGRADVFAVFLMGLEKLSAILGIAVLVLQRFDDNGTLGVLSVNDVFHSVAACGTAEGTPGALDLDRIIGIGIDRVDLNVYKRLFGGGDQDLCIVLCVARGQRGVQLGINDLGILVKPKVIQCHTDGVRAGVIHASSHLHLKSLPVPTARKGIVANADLLDVAKLSAFEHFFDVEVMGREKALVENRQSYVVVLGSLDKVTALIIVTCKGLFNKHVEAVLKKVAGDGVMGIRIGGVDHKIYICSAEKLLVVGAHCASGIFSKGSFASFGVGFHYGDDLNVCVSFRFVEFSVNVSAASSLTDNGGSQFFHFMFSFRNKNFYCLHYTCFF